MTDDQAEATPIKRGRKACTECRQQKSRCDAYLDASKPCSRCRKVNAQCIISEPFKRENKRQKLSQLESETSQLRQRLESVSDHVTPASTGLQAASGTPMAASHANDWGSPSHHFHSMMPHGSRPSAVPLTASTISDGRLSMNQTPTSPRVLDGLCVEAHEIDDLFHIYFRDYSHFLPILDPAKPPDAYYSTSRVLFWAIIAASCRTYTKNPTLFESIRSRVHDLIFDSLKQVPTLESVQALLHIISWPFPKSQYVWHPTFVLTGALLHAALGIGLHIPAASQEFSKVQLRLTDEDIKHRAETWAYCVIVYQRTCVCKGNSSMTLQDLCQDTLQRKYLFMNMSPETSSRLKLQDIVTRCTKAASENGLQETRSDSDLSLKLLIRAAQEEIDGLKIEMNEGLDDLRNSVASLVIQSFHFYSASTSHDAMTIIHIFGTACGVLQKLDTLANRSVAGLKACPWYHTFALLLSSHVLLRLIKTPMMETCIDMHKAKEMVYLAINLARSMSLENNDTNSRMVTIVGQTLGSERAFKNPDGAQSLAPLRIRNRLAMGVVLDSVMWWREEFGGTTGLYPTSKLKPSNLNTVVTNIETTGEPLPQSPKPFSEDQMMPIIDPFISETGYAFDDLFSMFWTDTGA